MIDSGLVGGSHTRQEDVEVSPTKSHISPSILVYEDNRATENPVGRKGATGDAAEWAWEARVTAECHRSRVNSQTALYTLYIVYRQIF